MVEIGRTEYDPTTIQFDCSRVSMQHVSGNVGPVLAKDIRESVPTHCPSVLDGEVQQASDLKRVETSATSCPIAIAAIRDTCTCSIQCIYYCVYCVSESIDKEQL